MAIGSLAVRVSANTSQYQKGMKGTKGPANNLKRQMGDVAKKAAKMTAAMAAAGAAIAAHLTKQGLEAVDAQAKLGRQLGITQAEVAGLTRVAKDAGIEQGQMESNLQALNKRLGEAQEGSGRAADTLKRLGISAQELAEMPMAERMDTIGEAINGLSTQTEKASATADLFSRSGLDMMNVFAQGEGAIERATEEARGFGTAVTEVDSARIEAANDAMSRIGDVVQGVSNQLASELSPILQGVAELFTDSASEAGGFRDQIENAVNVGIAGAGALADAWRGIEVVIAGGRVAIARLIQGFFELAQVVNNTMQSGANAIENFENFLRQQATNISGIEFEEFRWDPLGGSRENIEREIEFAKSNTEAFTEDMVEILNRPLPSDSLDNWVEDVRTKTREAAEAAREGTAAMIDPALLDPFFETQTMMTEKQREELQKRLNSLRESQATERELLATKREEDLELLRQAKENELITEQEFRMREREVESAHMAQMKKLRQDGMSDIEKVMQQSWDKQLVYGLDSLVSMTQGIDRESKKAFQINKRAAQANAVIKGYQAAVSAWEAGMSVGGPAAPAIAAAFTALSLARTGAQIKAIGSQSFGGGGGSPSQAAQPSTPVHDTGGASGGNGGGGGSGGGDGGNGGGATFNISLHGQNQSTESVRQLIEQINEASGDGVQLNASTP